MTDYETKPYWRTAYDALEALPTSEAFAVIADLASTKRELYDLLIEWAEEVTQ